MLKIFQVIRVNSWNLKIEKQNSKAKLGHKSEQEDIFADDWLHSQIYTRNKASTKSIRNYIGSRSHQLPILQHHVYEPSYPTNINIKTQTHPKKFNFANLELNFEHMVYLQFTLGNS